MNQKSLFSDDKGSHQEEIPYEVEECTLCADLTDNRTNIVNGVGNCDSGVMMVGEAPGKDEDQQSEPFVGRSGKYLTDRIEERGYEREDLRITNVVKCRPPSNRSPKKKERLNCRPYLYSEIKYFDPDVIVTLGSSSTENILNEDVSITEVSGEEEIVTIRNSRYKVCPTVHPAAVLRNRKWGDLLNDVLDEVLGDVQPCL